MMTFLGLKFKRYQ